MSKIGGAPGGINPRPGDIGESELADQSGRTESQQQARSPAPPAAKSFEAATEVKNEYFSQGHQVKGALNRLIADAGQVSSGRLLIPSSATGILANDPSFTGVGYKVANALVETGADALLSEFMKLSVEDPASNPEALSDLLETARKVDDLAREAAYKKTQTEVDEAQAAKEYADSWEGFVNAMKTIINVFSQKLSESEVAVLTNMVEEAGFTGAEAKSFISSMLALYNGSGDNQDLSNVKNLLNTLSEAKAENLLKNIFTQMFEWYQDSITLNDLRNDILKNNTSFLIEP